MPREEESSLPSWVDMGLLTSHSGPLLQFCRPELLLVHHRMLHEAGKGMWLLVLELNTQGGCPKQTVLVVCVVLPSGPSFKDPSVLRLITGACM